jgi:hypothetical protein
MNQLKTITAILLAIFVCGSGAGFASGAQAEGQSQDDSIAVRKEQTFYLTPGIGLSNGIGIGLKLGYFLKPDYVLEYSTNTTTNLGGTSDINQSVMVRSFLGNSFNIAMGVNNRREKIEFQTDKLVSVFDSAIQRSSDANITGIKNHITATDYGIQVFLGNQWQWSYVTLGIDWVGYYHPLKTLENKLVQEISYKGGRNDRRESQLKQGKNLDPSVSLIWLYLGISF